MNLNKKLLKNTNSALTVLIVIGIIAVVNFFSYQIFFRWDLTQNKDYSISKVSKKAASKLDDIVNIKVYFSESLPSQYITLRQEVGDILDEYVNFSNGNVRVEFIDPTDDADLEQELMIKGIPQLQFNVLEKDKYEVVRGYLGITVEYGDNTEAIPVVENTRNLEYQITLAIKKVTDQINAIIGIVSSNSTLNPESEISVAYKKINELYQIRNIDLNAEREIPFDINTLVIAGPKNAFNDEQLRKIDSFLMRGGSVLVLVDGVKIGDGLLASKNDINLDNLLLNYGVRLNHDLVLDVSSEMASFTQGFFTFSTNYPFWPKIIKQGFDKDSPAVAKLESVSLPWVSSLDVVEETVANNNVSYLLKTTPRSWAQTENYNLDPQSRSLGTPTGDIRERNLAISISGEFNSAYGEESTQQARLIVVGDSEFATDGFLQRNPDNLILFQNLVDSLSLDEDLINIRSKGVTSRPIEEISDGVRVAIRYSNIFGLTLVVVVFGLARYYIRRRSKFVDEL